LARGARRGGAERAPRRGRRRSGRAARGLRRHGRPRRPADREKRPRSREDAGDSPRSRAPRPRPPAPGNALLPGARVAAGGNVRYIAAPMAKNLVIVESPAKARTLTKYLGRNYQVKASVGHVVDLPKSKLGVAIEKDFEPEYQIIHGKK